VKTAPERAGKATKHADSATRFFHWRRRSLDRGSDRAYRQAMKTKRTIPAKKKPDPDVETVADDEAEGDDEDDTDGTGPDETAVSAKNVPLLWAGDDKDNQIMTVGVERIEPSIEEGWLGKIDPTSTETDLKNRWGGGRYKLTGRSAAYRILRCRTVVIAGSPKFESALNRAKWAAQSRAQMTDADGNAIPDAPTAGGADLTVALYKMQIDQMREDQSRREREYEQREERRRQEAAEAEDRRRREMQEARQRDLDHMTTLVTLMKGGEHSTPQGNPIDAFTRGIEMAMKFRGGAGADDDEGDDEDDFRTMARELVKGAVDGFKGKKGGDESSGDDGSVKFTGKTAEKLKRFVVAARRKGVDPESVLNSVFDRMTERADTKPAKRPMKKGSTSKPKKAEKS
jgi:hypothetical protein